MIFHSEIEIKFQLIDSRYIDIEYKSKISCRLINLHLVVLHA